MNSELERRRQEVADRCGEWTAHNIYLKEDVYTYPSTHPKFNEQIKGHGLHLQRIIQIVSDIISQPLHSLRVLDLGCLEGLYGLEFARRGAEVVGIEGREINIERARFAKEVMAIDNIAFVQDDVRNLTVAKYGQFDVVLCIGILYHLDVPDVFHFVHRLVEVCKRLTIIDTHISVRPNAIQTYRGQQYSGWSYMEFQPGTSREAKLKSPWASLENEKSFWFTRPSLFNLLSSAGFSSVYTCQNPAVPGQWIDRDTLVAIKGERQELVCIPPVNDFPAERWTEDSRVGAHPSQQDTLEPKRKGLFRRIRNLARRIVP